MSTLHGMNGRLARAEKKAPKPPENHETKELDLTPFTDEEVEHIHMVWAIIENDFHRLYRLTDEQFEYVKLVIHMDEVDQAGEQAAERHRQMAELAAGPHFSQRLEQLVEQFLSIDENLIPDYAEVKEWWKHTDELPPDYRMRRSWYRQRKEHIERQLVLGVSLAGERMRNLSSYSDEMRAWVDAYGDA